MISPWTIYPEKKQDSLTKKGKKALDENSKNKKKQKKLTNKNQNDKQKDQENFRNDSQEAIQQNSLSKTLQKLSDHQEQSVLLQENNQTFLPEQRKIQNIQKSLIATAKNHKNKKNQGETLNPEQTEQVSKQFLKNVIIDYNDGSIDNFKLLDFSRNYSHKSSQGKEDQHIKRKRSLGGERMIRQERQNYFRGLQYSLILKMMKASLKKQQQIEKQVEQNIEKIMKKLSPEHFSKMSPQQILLEKLLKNQKQKMQQNESSKKKKPKKTQKYLELKKQSLESKFFNDNKITQIGLLKQLRSDIEKSSIIKYAANHSQILPNSESQSNEKKVSRHLEQEIRQQIINAHTFSRKDHENPESKAFSISKKAVIDKYYKSNLQKGSLNQSNSQQNEKKEKENQLDTSCIVARKNNNGKYFIQQLIKRHIALRQQRRDLKKQKQSRRKQPLQIQTYKLKGKNQANNQSNLLSKSIKTARQLNLSVSPRVPKRNTSLQLSSQPLIPPQFQLPRIPSVQSQSLKSKLSPSNQLLQMITSNIVSNNERIHKRNLRQVTKEGSKDSLIDKLFIKNKDIKQVRIRRNKSQSKGIISQGKQVFDKILGQNHGIKTIQTIVENQHSKDILSKKQNNEQVEPYASLNLISKQRFSPEDYDYNFRKKKHKLNPLESELISLIQPEKEVKVSQLNQSQLKFSDSKIIHACEDSLKFTIPINQFG